MAGQGGSRRQPLLRKPRQPLLRERGQSLVRKPGQPLVRKPGQPLLRKPRQPLLRPAGRSAVHVRPEHLRPGTGQLPAGPAPGRIRRLRPVPGAGGVPHRRHVPAPGRVRPLVRDGPVRRRRRPRPTPPRRCVPTESAQRAMRVNHFTSMISDLLRLYRV